MKMNKDGSIEAGKIFMTRESVDIAPTRMRRGHCDSHNHAHLDE